MSLEDCEERLGCRYIDYPVISYNKWSCCCYKNAHQIRFDKDFREIYRTYVKWRDSTLTGWVNGLPTSCGNCHEIKCGSYAKSPKVPYFNISSRLKGVKCNLKCIYCNSYKDEQISSIYDETKHILAIIKQIGDLVGVDEDYNLVISAGEITIADGKDEIFDTIRKNRWNVRIFTNATVYNQDLFDLLKNNKATINCSLDAGTKETYAKIKGADCWEKTVNNLKKYASANKKAITLKYIFMEGYNDSFDEIDEFFSLAFEIAGDIVLSFDRRERDGSMSADMMEYVRYFLNKCKVYKFNVRASNESFNDEDLLRVEELLSECQGH